jgi:hypothetical protein
MISWSDGAGIAAGVLFGIPPVKDQIGRWNEASQTKDSIVPNLRDRLRAAMKEKRDAFSGGDSMILLGGSILLIASFVLKTLDR